MGNVDQLKEIEKAVSQLSPQDLREFRHWFTEFDDDLPFADFLNANDIH